MASKFLLFAKDGSSSEFFKNAASEMQASIERVSHVKPMLEQLANPQVTCAFAEVTTMAEAEEVSRFKASDDLANKLHVIVSTQEGSVVEKSLFESSIAGCVILKGFENAASAQVFTRTLRVPTSRAQGLKLILDGCKNIETLTFDSTMQKGFAAQSVAFRLAEHGCASAIASRIATAVDELLLNAMYDAPVNEAGQRLYKNSDNPDLGDASGVELQVGIEGELFGATVIDHFGSASRSGIMRRVAKFFHDGPMEMEEEITSSGAGLGLSMILDAGGSLCMVCHPGRRTEVTALFRLGGNFRDVRNQFQFFSAYVLK